MATGKRHTPEKVVRKLVEADRMLAEGGREGRGRLPRAAGHGGDLLPLAQPVRRAESRRREAAQGPGEGERDAQEAAGRCGAGVGRLSWLELVRA